jgi:hypothetical protein
MPKDEQAAIGRFLDWANARLERTIRAKRSDALLMEQKQVVVQRAVTQAQSTTPLKPRAFLGSMKFRNTGKSDDLAPPFQSDRLPFASSGFVRHQRAVRLLRA